MYAMAVLINLLGCAWLFTARCEGYDRSWLTSVGEHAEPAGPEYLEHALQLPTLLRHAWQLSMLGRLGTGCHADSLNQRVELQSQ